ncbi:hypothetical protein [Aurantibacillus circumpalustris]|uniref:hypothetical protein n=1 Tax=Aurantibacillus circumpalustris TaxID=3036359 RepID=UPI00295B7A75|nr:hypothetical protein [Aurantibacillus circumpalustris]
MSNHFTYEIDERHLRTQLKEATVAVSEEAWEKFETFTDSIVSDHRENRFANLNFTMNRNIVLPSVFGIIIIIFSFLLVNFVSIKTSVKEKSESPETDAVTMNSEEPKQAEKKALPVLVKKAKPEIESVQAVSQNEDLIKEEKAIVVVETPKELSKQESNSNSTVANLVPAITNPASAVNSSETTIDSVANAAADEEAKAKRRAKRRAEAVETQKLQEIRPTPVMEERDVEIRPN